MRKVFVASALLLLSSCGGENPGFGDGPVIALSTEVVDFGDVPIGQTQARVVRIREVTGTSSSNELLIDLGTDPKEFTYTASRLLFTDFADLEIQFLPTMARPYLHEVRVQLRASDRMSEEKTLEVAGAGLN